MRKESNMKKFVTLLLVVSAVATSGFAQRNDVWENYKSTVNSVFSEISPAKITTGLLIEKAIPYVDLSYYNGEKNSDTCMFVLWTKMYSQFCMAHSNYEEIIFGREFGAEMPQTPYEIPIGIAFFKYNQFKPAVLQREKVVLDTVKGKFLDYTGVNGKIFDEKIAFSFAPFVQKIKTGTYSFTLSLEESFGKELADIEALSIDFGDGFGFQPIGFGQAVQVTYDWVGEKTMTLKAIFKGTEYVAYSKFFVESGNDGNQLKSFSFGTEPNVGPKSFYSNGIEAEYAVYNRCGSDGKVRKPYIIVSGFDPQDKNRLVDESDKVNLYRVSNKNDYLDQLRNDGYDIIIYRSKNSTESIIPNALNLVDFIKKINAEKSSDNELIIAGASMGGLVVRYALTYMEHNNIDHQTKLFISVDSPQEGANVPLGIQYMVKYLNKDMLDAVSKLKSVENNILNSNAAKEMLLYHHSATSGSTAQCAGNRTTFLDELNKIGYFPKQCRTIALSMGSGVGTSQGFSAGDELLRKDPKISLLVPIGAPVERITWEFSVNAVPNQQNATIYYESANLKTCVRLLRKTYCTNGVTIASRKETVNNTMAIDNAPGSIQNLHNLKSFHGQGYLLGKDYMDILEDLGEISYDGHPDNFIPSYSSVGLENITNPHVNIKNYLRLSSSFVPVTNNIFVKSKDTNLSLFDVIYIENKNLDHIYDDNKVGVFTNDMITFMNQETNPQELFIENYSAHNGHRTAWESKESVHIGNSVDEIAYNNGDVVIESGAKATVRANKKILLEPGTKIAKGSSFSAKIGTEPSCSDNEMYSLKNYDDEEIPAETAPQSSMISLVETYSEPVIVYPNPVTDNMVISSNKTGNTATLFDMQGKQVVSVVFQKNVELDCSAIPAGVYSLQVIQGNGKVITKQIIKR